MFNETYCESFGADCFNEGDCMIRRETTNMIKILDISNTTKKGMSRIALDIADLINKVIDENDIKEENIINIQLVGNSKATIIYKV